jgi:hypothetical protein
MKPTVPSIKGTHIVALVKGLRAQRAKALALLSPKLHHYLDDRILAGSWYPDEDHRQLLNVLAALNPQIPDFWGYIGLVAARATLNSVYKAMIAPGDPMQTLMRTSRHYALYHSHGRLEVTPVDKNHAKFEIFDNSTASPEMCRTLTVFYAQTLNLAGALEVKFVKRLCRASGSHCLWEVEWQMPSEAPVPEPE